MPKSKDTCELQSSRMWRDVPHRWRFTKSVVNNIDWSSVTISDTDDDVKPENNYSSDIYECVYCGKTKTITAGPVTENE